MLSHIGANASRLITTGQVEMEYKKNRQRVILDSLSRTKAPDWNSLTVPAFLADSKPSKAIERGKKLVDAQTRRMRTRIEAVLENPAKNDPVYKVVNPLFKSTSEFNLSRTNEARDRIRRLAVKRFYLGYPPRKDQDTSIGDAINWEWIIHCAVASGKNVVTGRAA